MKMHGNSSSDNEMLIFALKMHYNANFDKKNDFCTENADLDIEMPIFALKMHKKRQI